MKTLTQLVIDSAIIVINAKINSLDMINAKISDEVLQNTIMWSTELGDEVNKREKEMRKLQRVIKVLESYEW